MALDYKVLNECYQILTSEGQFTSKLEEIHEKLEQAGEIVEKDEIIHYLCAHVAKETASKEEKVDQKGIKELTQKLESVTNKKTQAARARIEKKSEVDPNSFDGEIEKLQNELGEAQQNAQKQESEHFAEVHQKSIKQRKDALIKFFEVKENRLLLSKEDEQGKIPAVVLLDSKVADIEFILQLIELTPDFEKYKYKKPVDLSESNLSQRSPSRSRSRVSQSESPIEADQTLVDYVVATREIDENSANLAISMLRMGISLTAQFSASSENPVLRKLLNLIAGQKGALPAFTESRPEKSFFQAVDRKEQYKRNLVSEICLHFLVEKKDPSLFFDLLRQHKVLRPRSSSSHSRRSSVSDFEGQSSVASDEQLKNFFAGFLNYIFENPELLLIVDEQNKENIGSFLLRKEKETELLRDLGTIFQRRDNLNKLPIELFSLKSKDGRTILHLAAANPEADLINHFLFHIINNSDQETYEEIVSISDNNNQLPFHRACEIGFDDGIEALFFPQFLAIESMKDGEILSPLSQVIIAGLAGFGKSCKTLLRLGAGNIDYSPSITNHPLAVAIAKGRESILGSLLQFGMNPNQVFVIPRSSHPNISVLQHAINHKNFSAIKTLIEYGAQFKDEQGREFAYYENYKKTLSEDKKQELEEEEKSYQQNKEEIQQEIFARKELAPKVGDAFVRNRKRLCDLRKMNCRSTSYEKAETAVKNILNADSEEKVLSNEKEVTNILTSLIEKSFKECVENTDYFRTFEDSEIKIRVERNIKMLDSFEVFDIKQAAIKTNLKASYDLISHAIEEKKFASLKEGFLELFKEIATIAKLKEVKREDLASYTRKFEELKEQVWERKGSVVLREASANKVKQTAQTRTTDGS